MPTVVPVEQAKDYKKPRPNYQPAELVDYIAQAGDTLPALSIRFNTTIDEIRKANPIIPSDATTMPPGMPMKIPVYYLPFWGTQFKIVPDSLFVNGPDQKDFDIQAFLDKYPGWIKDYTSYAEDANHTGAEIINLIAQDYLVSPRLLLAMMEYQSGSLTQADLPEDNRMYPMGYRDSHYKDLYLQMMWAANLLNDGYYRWREGSLTQFELKDGRIERPDPWQNAATVALQNFFLQLHSQEGYDHSISPEGFAATYQKLFGDPWSVDQAHIPGNLRQPDFILPFEPNRTWALTGGPHTGWGSGQPWSALDFAPPSVAFGCITSEEWVTAVSSGVVTRSNNGLIALDLDGDGDERTGWVIMYLHIATKDRVSLGKRLETGDHIGHPSCEGGRATGTHVHITRQFNGEWVPAYGTMAFDFEGWIAQKGEEPYKGTLVRYPQTVIANTNATYKSFIARNMR
ncbi:MAG: LysM peptidoglycan-binding domain-containing protein [Chloroflexota bacterium]